jgi:hypothetical protein
MIELNGTEKNIKVQIPLTKNSGKIRIKNRSILNEYGLNYATRRDPFKQSNYVEWMIGYDVVTKKEDKLKLTTLPNLRFTGANDKEKALYELSEFIYYFYKWNVIKKDDLTEIKTFLENIDEDKLLENHEKLQISRDNFKKQEINGINFNLTHVKYPLLVQEFGSFEIVCEIKITEQQYAMSTQAMIYLCFPITELESKKTLLGRVAETKESACFNINEKNISVFLEILKSFGFLSSSHKTDVLRIIDLILGLHDGNV